MMNIRKFDCVPARFRPWRYLLRFGQGSLARRRNFHSEGGRPGADGRRNAERQNHFPSADGLLNIKIILEKWESFNFSTISLIFHDAKVKKLRFFDLLCIMHIFPLNQRLTDKARLDPLYKAFFNAFADYGISRTFFPEINVTGWFVKY